jgi:hypothetical protein
VPRRQVRTCTPSRAALRARDRRRRSA